MQLLKEKAALLNNMFAALEPQQYGQLGQFLTTFTKEVSFLEQFYSPASIIGLLAPIRQSAAASPFFNRTQQWPRGYAGDYQTIAYILNGENKAEAGTLAYDIEDYFLNASICRQHRNKVAIQQELIAATIRTNPYASILSIGCGTSEDIYQCKQSLMATHSRITLIDIDEEALSCSINRLRELGGRVKGIKGNIYKIIKTLDQRFDLVIIGGVFDYLKHKAVAAIITETKNKLHLNGKLFFTNIITDNPYRISMEYLANWRLIERSEEHIIELVQQSGTAMPFDIQRDETGLACLVTIHNTINLN